ncbi:hypothetical protein [Paenibacillus tengchongensis]|uniref:hypothetical protein n=1 Tax=Paenibacillus tengchongensis TaxID=2608684 RepID=UPI00124CF579|nr:hypothetical protein [Paenibacillus tengchongensis]
MSSGENGKQGGTGGVGELDKRIEDMEYGLNAMKNEFVRLSGEALAADKRLKVLEENVRRHEEGLTQLKETTIEMKVQYSSIIGKIDSLENKIFSLLQQTGKDSAAERKFWMDLLKYVLGGTIFVIIGYVFLGGA